MRERARNPEWIILGAGGHSKVIYDILLELCDHQDILVLDDNPIPPIRKAPPTLPPGRVVHGIGDLAVRRELQKKRYVNNIWPKIIARTAHIGYNVLIEDGTQILHFALVGPFSMIGKGVIINHHASVDHDCKIGSFNHIAPGVTLCGGVIVGNRTLIGAGSVVCPDVIIGDDCIVAAGSRVFIDIPDNSIMLPNGRICIRRSFQNKIKLENSYKESQPKETQ